MIAREFIQPSRAMNGKPLVSTIMTFFNEEKFLAEAIESVFAQTYKNWELLLVDDGSTDGSSKIALRYAEQSPEKVRYFEHDQHRNRGASAARNLGISNAKGELIALLDADDIWLPCKLDHQVAILKSQPEAAMLCGATQWWYSWTGNPQDAKRDHIRRLSVQADTLVMPPNLITLFLKNKNTPCTCSVLLRREIVEAAGGFEEAFRHVFTDQAFYAKVCLMAPVFVSGECWDRYRQHAHSCCSVAKATNGLHSAELLYLRWLESYLLREGIENVELWRALKQKQWRSRHPTLAHLLQRVERNLARMRSRSGWMEIFSSLRRRMRAHPSSVTG
jgi:glycosyltransferase involved in cell wall biosynthesis